MNESRTTPTSGVELEISSLTGTDIDSVRSKVPSYVNGVGAKIEAESKGGISKADSYNTILDARVD